MGVSKVCYRIFKKDTDSGSVGALVDVIFSEQYSSIYGHWIGIIAYTLQIYFDFSGYSDMAIGLGKVFGFDFLENFNYPYISQSIQEFWRRWHISLSSWFRDYLYIPLGGSRVGKIRTYVNLVIVFFMTGLWHGASLNFIIWGLFYGVFLIIERLGLKNVLAKMPRLVRHIYSLLIIMIGWVFFRADGLRNSIVYIERMFIPSGNDWVNFNYVMNLQYWSCLIVGLFVAVPHTRVGYTIKKYKIGSSVLDFSLIFIFLLAICYMVGSGYSPFLYFRF